MQIKIKWTYMTLLTKYIYSYISIYTYVYSDICTHIIYRYHKHLFA